MTTKIVGNAPHLEQFFPSPGGEFNNTYKSFYSSPEKFANFVEDIDDYWHATAWETDNSDWAGTKSMKEALDLIRSGWKDGVEQVRKMQSRVLAKHPITKIRKQFGIIGDIPDVPRAVSGNPMNMRKPVPGKGKRKIITLISDMSAHCGHGSEEFLNRAAVVAAIIDQIEASGYSCEVIAIAYSQNKPLVEAMTHVLLKDSSQPTDVARLAFGLGHPGMFRRLVFADWSWSDFTKNLGYGLGYNHTINIGGRIQKDLAEKDMYVVPSVNENSFFRTVESSETQGFVYLMQALREQKCPCFSYEGIPQEKLKQRRSLLDRPEEDDYDDDED